MIAASALLLASLEAHADTIFKLSGEVQPGLGDLITGTVTLNAASTAVSSINATYVQDEFPSNTHIYVFTTLSGQQVVQPPVLYGFSSTITEPGLYNYTTLEIALPVSSLSNYQGGPVCSVTNVCKTSGGGEVSAIEFQNYSCVMNYCSTTYSFIPLYSVSLTAAATNSTSVTPEPSSLMLIGTGMLGLAGSMKRRFAKNSGF